MRLKASKFLEKGTFWDSDFESLDLEVDKRFIIPRVLMRGTEEDFFFVLSYYSLQALKDVLLNVRYLEMRTLHFCAFYLQEDIKNFRAFQWMQSTQNKDVFYLC